MTSQIESIRRAQYTPLYKNYKFESGNKSMETTNTVYLTREEYCNNENVCYSFICRNDMRKIINKTFKLN